MNLEGTSTATTVKSIRIKSRLLVKAFRGYSYTWFPFAATLYSDICRFLTSSPLANPHCSSKLEAYTDIIGKTAG